MFDNAAYTAEYLRILQELDGDCPGRRRAYRYLQASTAISHGTPATATFVPRLFDADSFTLMKRTAEGIHGILCKVSERYRHDPLYRKLFQYDDRLADLMLLPRDYDAVLPFVRIDGFLDEKTGRICFCEFNGDGSTGMNEDREAVNSLLRSETFRRFTERHAVASCELIDSWVRTFMDIYQTYRFKVADPHIAICDYLDLGTVSEFEVYADAFRKSGVACDIVDVRDLVFDGEALRGPDGAVIHAIWRRAVTCDVLAFWDESQALIEAVLARKVALIGAFSSHIAHDKQLFSVLRSAQTRAFLTEEESRLIEETVPPTFLLDDPAAPLHHVRSHREDWVLKPTARYGADGVQVGRETDAAIWQRALDDALADHAESYLVQQFLSPFQTLTLPPDTEVILGRENPGTQLVLYYNLTGLYLYNGHFQGVFSRLGPHLKICEPNEGMTAATLWVDRHRISPEAADSAPHAPVVPSDKPRREAMTASTSNEQTPRQSPTKRPYAICLASPKDENAIAYLAAQADMGELSARGIVYVAKSDNDVVGFIRLVKDKGPWHVNPIVVAEHHRREGIGAALMAFARDRYGELRFVARGQSVSFYEALGCTPTAWTDIAPLVARDCDGCELYETCSPQPMRMA